MTVFRKMSERKGFLLGKVLVIGCGGVASVAISKCCQVSDVFTELCIASRTKSKCDALAAKLDAQRSEMAEQIAAKEAKLQAELAH